MKFCSLAFLAALGSVSAFSPSFGGVSRSSTTTALDATRKPFISGNWKLNPQTRDEAVALASEISAAIGPDTPDADVALFVPYVFIEAAMGAVDSKLFIGAEVSLLFVFLNRHSFVVVVVFCCHLEGENRHAFQMFSLGEEPNNNGFLPRNKKKKIIVCDFQ